MRSQRHKTQRFQVGDATITKVVELEVPGVMHSIVPQATRDNLLLEPWLQPHFCTAQGDAILSIHSFVVELDGMRMLVDTCVGNDKEDRVRGLNRLNGPFLQDLEAEGFAADSIDRVLCTHLHVDHVGWNTRKVDGRWVPTFKNARYLFEQNELRHWLAADEGTGKHVANDSVVPIVEAGLADEVQSDHKVSDGVWLEPTPGHTPGHVSVHIASAGYEAVITGDLMHHPAQTAHPEWESSADVEPALATRTRRAFIDRYADTPTLILGTHFATPTAGHIIRDGDRHRFVAVRD